MGSDSKKKKKKKKRKQVEVSKQIPAAYAEDLVATTEDLLTCSSSIQTGISSKNEKDNRSNSWGEVKVTKKEKKRRLERLSRFSSSKSQTNNVSPAHIKGKKMKGNKGKDGKGLVGTCLSIEKTYLRLTSAPLPENVRPLHILKISLAHVKQRYVNDEVQNFAWANEQLKSIRQDITVQESLRHTKFALEVYEVHARVSLEHGDLNEFNQCQTSIKSLQPSRGKLGSKIVKQNKANADEYAAYRLLCESLLMNYIYFIPVLVRKLITMMFRCACTTKFIRCENRDGEYS